MNETERQDRVFLGTEPVGKLMLRLAAPSILAQIINVLYNIVDRIYIGHMPRVGALALTGLGVCAPLLIIVSAFAMLSAMGGAPLASMPWAGAITPAPSAFWACALRCSCCSRRC